MTAADAAAAGRGRRRLPVLPPPVAFAGGAAAFAALYLAAGAPTTLLVEFQAEWGFPDWMLTLAFGVYALFLLGALVVTGRLSDHIGRRPVIVAGLALQLVAVGLYIAADGIGWLIAARIVQGVATGVATSTYTAALIEFAEGRRIGAVIGSVMPTAGLGVGAILAALVVVSGVPGGDAALFWFFAALVVVGLVVALLSPETITRTPGALASLRPQVRVPRAVREFFWRCSPLVVACWMTGSIVMSFAPTVLLALHDLREPLVNGTNGLAHAAANTLGGLIFARLAVRTALRVSAAGIALGTVVVLAGLLTGTLPLLLAGTLVQGLAFGAGFTATVRGVAALSLPHQRGGLFAALFTLTYLALSLPSLLAGALVALVGAGPVIIGWSVVIVAAAAAGWALARNPAAPVPTDPAAR